MSIISFCNSIFHFLKLLSDFFKKYILVQKILNVIEVIIVIQIHGAAGTFISGDRCGG